MRTTQSAAVLSLLSAEQISRIHYAALEILERVGVVFQHDRALELMSSIGCKVDRRTQLVKIPAHLVEQAIEWTPATVRIYDREGALRMKLERREVYYGAGLTCPLLVEADGARKPYTLQECAKNARVADALENIDFTMAMAHVTDVPVEVRDVVEIKTVLQNSVKPIIVTSHSPQSLDVIVEMCGVLSSSRENFLEKPYLIYYTEPVSPLQHTTHSLEKLFKAVAYGLPLLNTPAPMAGGTAPISMVGTALTCLAEELSGLVLIQNLRRGAPVIFGGVCGALDMKSMVFVYGAPEVQLLNTTIAQMAQYYEIPSFGTGGACDAHELDEQAAYECGLSIFANGLSGSNLVHDLGWMSSAMGTSNELLILCNEIVGYARRYFRGIDTGLIDASLQELLEVGPGGNFLDRSLTAELFKAEVWYPKLMSRSAYKQWETSEKTPLKMRLKSEVDRLLRTHQPAPIHSERLRDIERLVQARRWLA